MHTEIKYEQKTPNPINFFPVIQSLSLTFVNFSKPDRLCPVLQNLPFHHNLVSTHSRQDFSPSSPIHHTQQKHTDTHDGENIVRVSVWVGGARGWDKGDDGEEDVRKEKDDDDGQVGMPWGCPFFGGSVVEVYEAAGDEGVYPGAWVGVAVGHGVSRGREDWEKSM